MPRMMIIRSIIQQQQKNVFTSRRTIRITIGGGPLSSESTTNTKATPHAAAAAAAAAVGYFSTTTLANTAAIPRRIQQHHHPQVVYDGQYHHHQQQQYRQRSLLLRQRQRQHSHCCSFFSTSTTNNKASTSTRTDPSTISSLSSEASTEAFLKTPLARKGAGYLVEGLDVYSVPSLNDGHPLAVYGINSEDANPIQYSTENPKKQVMPILLLHGRTWSSLPVYHLHLKNYYCSSKTSDEDDNNDGKEQQGHAGGSRSLMESLLEKGLQPYAMDFRGFGGTSHDSTKCVEPNVCVEDAVSVLKWIAERHGMTSTMPDTTSCDYYHDHDQWPCLLGWSQGAMVAQLVAQRNFPCISKLVLYGSIYDPLIRYAREPLYTSSSSSTTPSAAASDTTDPTDPDQPEIIYNTYDDAIEDFTIEGTIPPEAAREFAEAALITDPIKAVWKHQYQFNNCDPARVHVPTLVLAGDQDPYAPLHVQQDLFTNLGRSSDRTWSILTGCDHAVHLLEERDRMINIVVSFIKNTKRSEQQR